MTANRERWSEREHRYVTDDELDYTNPANCYGHNHPTRHVPEPAPNPLTGPELIAALQAAVNRRRAERKENP